MENLDLISTGLYRLMNALMGSDDIVQMRRTVMELKHTMNNVSFGGNTAIESMYLSGSKAEGLRFTSSDYDYMFIMRGIRVIFCYTQLPLCNNVTSLMAECKEERPGFALLRLVTKTANPLIKDSCVWHYNSGYLSSTIWRNYPMNNTGRDVQDIIHGPCASYVYGGSECDKAFCIRSDFWPESARSCIRRLRRAGWPSQKVLSNIVEDGCLFVPIGSKDSLNEEYEWRLSFSLAEKSLVHNMTHGQFLTYALLKIFLKDAIEENHEVRGLLCSYFLKTILFWEITQPRRNWNEKDFLRNFWKCFQKLIIFVTAGYCPNFFIPENNMFKGKIKGATQQNLLSHLKSLYRDGYECILRCPLFHPVMIHTFHQPLLILRTLQKLAWKSVKDKELITEIFLAHIALDDDQEINLTYLQRFEFLLSRCSSPLASFIVEKWMKMFLPEVCLMLTKRCVQRVMSSNKMQYISKQTLLKTCLSSECETVRHFLYLATTLYHYGDFATCIVLLSKAKRRLQHPSLMYLWNLDVDKYWAAGGETTPIAKMMTTTIAFSPMLKSSTCIPGLELEHEAARRYFSDNILIPPLVLTNVLLYLCYRQEPREDAANTVLDELTTLVYYDQGTHIPRACRAISWQILGICHEMRGGYQEAYFAYCAAMQQPWCNIRRASEVRIRNMCSYLAQHNV